MTPKKEERIRNKIKKIKAALAADKKRWGGWYHDGGGLRYQPPQYFIQIRDYTGGIRYFNWFQKNFPDDIGYPDFMFEWAIVLFKTGKSNRAEEKIFEAFCRNTYLLDKYFGIPIVKIEKWEGSNLEKPEFAENYFHYSCEQEDLVDFSDWLHQIIQSEKFKFQCAQFMATQRLVHATIQSRR